MLDRSQVEIDKKLFLIGELTAVHGEKITNCEKKINSVIVKLDLMHDDMNVQRGQRKTWAAFLVMGIPGAGAVGGVLSKFFNF
tara:strand:+ start:405 stop:653 length:249 start_codon:yes stop_codon:yes gene_type:complete